LVCFFAFYKKEAEGYIAGVITGQLKLLLALQLTQV
jgi:hypothetical protein